MSSKLDYLKKYMSGDSTADDKDKKKKKKKSTSDVAHSATRPGGLVIVDHDTSAPIRSVMQDEEDDEDNPVIVNIDEFVKQEVRKRGNHSGWVTIQEGISEASSNNNNPRESPTLDVQRRGRRHDSPDIEAPRRARHDSPDIEAPRRRAQSPAATTTRRRHDSPDLDAPRRPRHDSPDIEAPRRVRHDSPDIEAPRRTRHDSPDLEAPRRRRHDSPDLDIPRRPRPSSSAENKADSDLEVPRKRPHGGAQPDDDLEPPRKTRTVVSTHDSDDLDVPRRKPEPEPAAAAASEKRMSSGMMAGLRIAAQIAEDAERKRREERERLRKMDPAMSGRDTETVYRDKHGRKMDPLQMHLAEQEAKKKKRPGEEEDELRKYEWGTGLVQKEQKEDLQKRLEEEKHKPFARYADDIDMNAELMDRDRWGDPMAGLISKKSKKSKKDKSSGEIEKPVYRGPPPPPNRFGIMPGHRWDGVDRSNGFEKQLFLSKSQAVDRAEKAYKWSTEDM
eukprot:GEZU01035848.1.p1 GENE.GEZU01035848.1~~GEZU01035848.1.p1  ORF type:complete len:515 (-),score=130.80 GEZU01035848.1:36-1544(-)